MSELILKQAAAVSALADSDAPYGAFEVILSTPTRDRDGEEVKTAEWELPLPDHITFDIDHGMSVSTTVGSGVPSIEGGNLVVRGTFASTELAQQTRALVNEGHIRTVSVAFLRKTIVDEAGNKSTVRELLNGAFVAIPANPEAVIMSSKAADMPMDDEVTEVGESLADCLRELLARVFGFYVQAHAAHWNVVGPDFTEWHDLFGEIYGDVYGSVDPLAENIRKIGSLAPSGLAEMVAVAGLEPAEPTTDALALAAAILEANTTLIEEIVEAFNCATACGEQGIANFLADRQDMHAKWSWQLSASLGIQTPSSDSEDGPASEPDENPQTSEADAAVVTAAADTAAVETSAADVDEESVQVLARALQIVAQAL